MLEMQSTCGYLPLCFPWIDDKKGPEGYYNLNYIQWHPFLGTNSLTAI